MNSYAIFCILTAVWVHQYECRHHHRSKIVRRQDQQTPQRFLRTIYPGQSATSQFQLKYPMNFSPPSQNGLPSQTNEHFPDTFGFSNGIRDVSPANPQDNFVASPDQAAIQTQNVARLPADSDSAPGDNNYPPQRDYPVAVIYSPPPFQSPFQSYSESDSSLQIFTPNSYHSKRKKKNASVRANDLLDFFEKGKKLLELSTKKDLLEQLNDTVINDTSESNTTLIPIPKGVEFKKVSNYDDGKVLEIVNISSSTLQTLTFDNNTEIENVVEMQMEKKIEDEKGAGKGLEEVRIIEKERVKPLIGQKWNSSSIRRRKRKSYKNAFITHRRSKRSNTLSEEVPRPKFVYNKMARRFLSVVRRKERVVEPSDFTKLQNIPIFKEINRRNPTESSRQAKFTSTHDKEEIEDFIKFFVNQMKMFRKSQENKKNVSDQFKRSCASRWCNSLKISPRNVRKLKKNLDYPEHMNIVMNLNMTWDSKMKQRAVQPLNVSEIRKTSTKLFDTITTASTELTTQQNTGNLAYMRETHDTQFLTTVWLFSAMTFLLTISTLIVPRLCRIAKLSRASSAPKTYEFYDECPDDKIKGLECDNFPSLEWQSESGGWLSERE